MVMMKNCNDAIKDEYCSGGSAIAEKFSEFYFGILYA